MIEDGAFSFNPLDRGIFFLTWKKLVTIRGKDMFQSP